jgi:hypothetical protein
MPQLLYLQGKSPWYPLDRRLGGPQSQSGHGGEEKNSQPLPGLIPHYLFCCKDIHKYACYVRDPRTIINYVLVNTKLPS